MWTRGRFFACAVVSCALAGCGDGGGGGAHGDAPPTIRTLAFAPTECRENATQFSLRQELRIQRDEGAPVTVAEVTETFVQESARLPGACRLFGELRLSLAIVFGGGIQRLGVSPDGLTVVFEKTNRFSVVGLPPLGPDREGFFTVRAGGSGLRRLGPASRDPITRFAVDTSAPMGFQAGIDPYVLSFSPDGRTVVFTDRGPGPADEDAIQVFTMDVATGVRTQVTRFPRAAPGNPPDPLRRDLSGVLFTLDGRIGFSSYVNVDGSNPNGEPRLYSVNPDGTGLVHDPFAVAVPGSIFRPTFVITGSRLVAWALNYFGDVPGAPDFWEIFAFDERGDGLQLTNFQRKDTGSGFRADVDGRRVLFTASVDPFGTNPSESCQIFSIDRLGTDLRQITTFNEGAAPSATGCGLREDAYLQSPPECTVGDLRQDEVTRAVVFTSTCDVFGDNPYGEQLFAMNPDGTALRQLTHTRGFTEIDNTVDVELPGPFASSAQPR
jgi:hypothetical protein